MKMASIEICIDILTEVKVCADEARREQLGSSYPIDVINIVETAKILQKPIAQNCVWHQETTGRWWIVFGKASFIYINLYIYYISAIYILEALVARAKTAISCSNSISFVFDMFWMLPTLSFNISFFYLPQGMSLHFWHVFLHILDECWVKRFILGLKCSQQPETLWKFCNTFWWKSPNLGGKILCMDYLDSFHYLWILVAWYCKWLSSFLCGGQIQLVLIRGGKLIQKSLLRGMSQGSTLLPQLFIIYTRSLGEVICQFGVWYHQHPDNAQLCFSPPGQPGDAVKVLSQGLVAECIWIGRNRLRLNSDKT